MRRPGCGQHGWLSRSYPGGHASAARAALRRIQCGYILWWAAAACRRTLRTPTAGSCQRSAWKKCSAATAEGMPRALRRKKGATKGEPPRCPTHSGGGGSKAIGHWWLGPTEGAEKILGRKEFGLAAVGKRTAQRCRAARESTPLAVRQWHGNGLESSSIGTTVSRCANAGMLRYRVTDREKERQRDRAQMRAREGVLFSRTQIERSPAWAGWASSWPVPDF